MQAASVGVFVKAGSRYEAVAGTSHLLQSLALGATQARSAAKVARDVEDMGARLSAHNGSYLPVPRHLPRYSQPTSQPVNDS